MGMFTALLTLPLAPVRGVIWLGEQLESEARRQWTDPASIRAQLTALDEQFERGELSTEQRDALQDELVARLLAHEPRS